MTEMNSQMKRNTEQAAEGYQAWELLWDPVFYLQNLATLYLSSYYPLLPLCHPKLGQCLLLTQTETKGQENPVVQSPEIILTWATG